jgi:hypothetical protein
MKKIIRLTENDLTKLVKRIINENKVSSYDEMYKLIVKYIKKTLKIEKPIIEFVPNTHIADKFKKVLIYLELENMYPSEFGLDKENSEYHILKILNSDEYFNKDLLENNGVDEIYRVYNKLSEKKDKIRNTMILANIELRDVIMKHLSNDDLKSHKIKIKL